MLNKATKEKINNEWENQKKSPRTIYKWKDLNNKTYQGYIADLMINEIDIIRLIKPTLRKNIFMRHIETTSQKESNQAEKMFAMALCHDERYDSYVLGKCFEYELPLCPRKGEHLNGDNKAFGNIDLVCIKEDEVYLIELKKDKSKETLLRTILEAYTYWKQGGALLRAELEGVLKIKDLKVRLGILIFKESEPEKELRCLSNTPSQKRLLDLISNEVGGVSFFIVNRETMPQMELRNRKIYFSDETWNTKEIEQRVILC